MAMVNKKGEIELLGRLGRAVAARWGAIPPFAQDQILNHAYQVEARFEGVDIREPSRRFWKGT